MRTCTRSSGDGRAPPRGLEDGELRALEPPCRPDHHRARSGVDPLHVERLGRADPEPLALAHGEAVDAGVSGQDLPPVVDHVPFGWGPATFSTKPA